MENCPVFNVADLVGKKWTIVLLQEISLNGSKGFNFILNRMRKISPKILTKRLVDLEKMGLIKKEVIDEKIKKSKYSLTKKGIELQKIIGNLKEWNNKYTGCSSECKDQECVKCDFY